MVSLPVETEANTLVIFESGEIFELIRSIWTFVLDQFYNFIS